MAYLKGGVKEMCMHILRKWYDSARVELLNSALIQPYPRFRRTYILISPILSDQRSQLLIVRLRKLKNIQSKQIYRQLERCIYRSQWKEISAQWLGVITLHADPRVHLPSLRNGNTDTEISTLDGNYSHPRIGLARRSRNIADWSIITKLPYLIRNAARTR